LNARRKEIRTSQRQRRRSEVRALASIQGLPTANLEHSEAMRASQTASPEVDAVVPRQTFPNRREVELSSPP
jgi:hypothetical protein